MRFYPAEKEHGMVLFAAARRQTPERGEKPRRGPPIAERSEDEEGGAAADKRKGGFPATGANPGGEAGRPDLEFRRANLPEFRAIIGRGGRTGKLAVDCRNAVNRQKNWRLTAVLQSTAIFFGG